MNDELRLIAEMTAKVGSDGAVRALLNGLVGPSRAEAGCLQYDLHEDREKSGHFMFFERWTNAAALEAHTKTPHYVATGPKLEPLLATTPVLTKLKQIG